MKHASKSQTGFFFPLNYSKVTTRNGYKNTDKENKTEEQRVSRIRSKY